MLPDVVVVVVVMVMVMVMAAAATMALLQMAVGEAGEVVDVDAARLR
jgi:hypothetical protein